jgi:Ca2+-binding EF-hand superfamily protein
MVFMRGQKVLTWGVMCMGIVSGSMHCLEQAASLFGSGSQAERSLMQTRTNSLQLRLDDTVIHNAFKNLSSGNESMRRDEFATGIQRLALGIHPFEIRDIFLEMDQNNDGKITRKVLS